MMKNKNENPEIEPGIRFNDLVEAAARVLRDPDSDDATTANRSQQPLEDTMPGGDQEQQQQQQHRSTTPQHRKLPPPNMQQQRHHHQNGGGPTTPPRRPPPEPTSSSRSATGAANRDCDANTGGDSSSSTSALRHQKLSAEVAADEQRKEQDLVTSILDSTDVDAVLEAAEERHRLEMLQLFDQMKAQREEASSTSMSRSPPNQRFPRKTSPPQDDDQHDQRQQPLYHDPNEAIDENRLVIPHEFASNQRQQKQQQQQQYNYQQHPPSYTSNNSRSNSQMDRASIARSRSLPAPTADDDDSESADNYPQRKNYAPRFPAGHQQQQQNQDFSRAAWSRAHNSGAIPPLDLSRLGGGGGGTGGRGKGHRNHHRGQHQQQQHGETNSSLSDTDDDETEESAAHRANRAIANSVQRAPDSNMAAARNRPPLAPGHRPRRGPIMAPAAEGPGGAAEQLLYDTTTGEDTTTSAPPYGGGGGGGGAVDGRSISQQHQPPVLADIGPPPQRRDGSAQHSAHRHPTDMRYEVLNNPLYNSSDPTSGGYGNTGDIVAPLPPVTRALENRARSVSHANNNNGAVMPSPRRVVVNDRDGTFNEQQQQQVRDAHNEPSSMTYYVPQPYYPSTLGHLQHQSAQNSVSRNPPTIGRERSVGAGSVNRDRPPSSVLAVIVPAGAKKGNSTANQRGPSNSPMAVAPPPKRPPLRRNSHMNNNQQDQQPDDGLDDETSFGPISSSAVSARPRKPLAPPGPDDDGDDNSQALPTDDIDSRAQSVVQPVVVRVDPKGTQQDSTAAPGPRAVDGEGKADEEGELPPPKEKTKSCC